MLRFEWWYYQGSYTWISITHVCRAEWCSPFGGFCNCSPSIQGWFLMSTWCLIVWTNPSSTRPSTSPFLFRFFDIAPTKLIWTFLFRIGRFGDGTFLSFWLTLDLFTQRFSESRVLWWRSETNLRPWEEEFGDIKQGSRRRSWYNKQPRAYWKGNPDVVSPIRLELMKCNHSRLWGAQIMRQVRDA